MLTPTEYSSLDAVGLADLIRRGEVSSHEVAAAALAAAAAVADLNAFAEGPWPAGLDHDPTGPLAGVPFAIKDVLCHAAGVPVHSGSRLLEQGTVHADDTILMSRFRKAGLVTVGTTRTPEFALSVSTEPRLGGPVLNPWDRSRSTGGSSGGSAAIVSAGVVPIAHANDGAGSIRIPAAHCGLFGLKPSRGRIPIGPDAQEVMYGNAAEFAVTRTLRDSAALLDIVHGDHAGEKYGAPRPPKPYRSITHDTGGRLRVAITHGGWGATKVDAQVISALTRVGSVLSSAGHEVTLADPPVDWDQLCDAVTTTWCAGAAAAVVPLATSMGYTRIDKAPLEKTTIACAEAGRRMGAVELGAAFDAYNAVSRSMAAFMEQWDVLISPTSVGPAPRLGTIDADSDDTAEQWVRRCLNPYPAAVLYNITGAPAMTVPVSLSRERLPLGVQLGASMYREDLLFQIADLLERECWTPAHRPPRHINTAGSH
ncbi:amidase [Gordonia sp. C13]|uniref:amidase n=1 Tax=Gordonia sp. C13 TaxID=2935078 RepID=UPI00200A966F|nr:amidase [Gordonia sp. C13]MCK8615518.1 amidase [Gordonia sp. C13]